MKKILLLSLLFNLLTITVFSQNTNAWRKKVAPEVLALIDQGKAVDVLVAFAEQADVSAAKKIHGKSAKAHYVFARLQETAQRSQARAMQVLKGSNASANTLFLVNALSVNNADGALTRKLAELPEVRFVCYDPWLFFPGPESSSPGNLTVDRSVIEWGVQYVKAPEVWQQGFFGQGITVGGADTGYDWAHPALQTHYRGWNTAANSADHNYNWHDAIHHYSPQSLDSVGNPLSPNPCGLSSDQPCDDNQHGTHTMGTMTGDDGQGNQIGVAPGAKWIGCRNMERGWGRPSTYIECFQWFLAPTDLGDQNPDPDKAPHVINNSWYCDYQEGCVDQSVNELIHVAVINVRASGVMVVVSNGNAGPGCGTATGAPAYFEESFSVGAFGINDSIAKFSSRGPSIIDTSYRIKPNISAPGVNVRSCVPNGEYKSLNGTSMAGPHIAGIVALVLSARPDLAGEVDILEDILEGAAVASADTIGCGGVPGTAVPNNTFGYGRTDALASVQAALGYTPVVTPVAPPVTALVIPNPLHGEASFYLNNLSGKTGLDIFGIDGKIVYSKKWSAYGAEIVHIPFEKHPAGVYFWQLTSENGVSSGKMIKQ